METNQLANMLEGDRTGHEEFHGAPSPSRGVETRWYGRSRPPHLSKLTDINQHTEIAGASQSKVVAASRSSRWRTGRDRPLLLLDGEELIGAKQDRILNTTVLVAAHTEVTIPVSCVEQGRCGYRGAASSARATPGSTPPSARGRRPG